MPADSVLAGHLEIETELHVGRCHTDESAARPEFRHLVWSDSWVIDELALVPQATLVGARYRKPGAVHGIGGKIRSHDLQRLPRVGAIRLTPGTNDPIRQRK